MRGWLENVQLKAEKRILFQILELLLYFFFHLKLKCYVSTFCAKTTVTDTIASKLHT